MTGTMAEKVWRDHIVSKGENGAPDLLFIDLHLVHEVTSPQASRACASPDARSVAPT